MVMKVSVAPINSLLFLSDVDGGRPPTPVWGATILSTPSCISFICFPEQDGQTELSMGARQEIDWGIKPNFEGDLETPHRVIVVSTVDEQTVMKMIVPTTRTHVCIWLSHPRWPERVAIGLGKPRGLPVGAITPSNR